MQLILNEQQWNSCFMDTCKIYKDILTGLHEKTLLQANNKAFAKEYFLKQIEIELEFQQGYGFNGTLISYFQIFYNMGFSWAKFFKEARILQQIYIYDESNNSMNDYAKLKNDFTPQEIRRIVLESRILKGNEQETTIYDIVRCVLLSKTRNIDFVKYVAKYQTVCTFVQEIRNANEDDNVNHTNSIRTNNESIRWNANKGKKIELIRLLVALNDCKYFQMDNGYVPSQEQLMNYFSEMLSINLKHYEQDLSNGFESKLTTNTALFDKLKTAIEKRYHQKIEQNYCKK